MKNPYKRVLLKLSGEALAKENKTGIDFNKMLEIAQIIKDVLASSNLEIAIVIGGGNFWRGRNNTNMDSCTADYIGMLATTMNALALNDALLQTGVDSRVQTSIEMRQISEFFIRSRALKHLEKKRVVIFGAGVGSPFFSTDTAAALRASEIKADILLKATNVDYIYTKDPKKYNDYHEIKEISHLEFMKEKIQVMDLTAVSLCMENNLPIQIFNINNLDNLKKALNGEQIGSLIK